ncbi:MAG: bifunctional 5,10-methylenetetrahydrofolate dehydrogenase/5,10-methenyltetrahydrofolate cyclohydrolase [Anaerolineae bacterium]|nr:bifunctional 5,10-methylenetetrahydrofolate dehydrogenase/5,10-methenyltetrahydrofolate cyclohydrolase [Anaerolineae bacterium]
MSATLIDGEVIAVRMRAEIAAQVQQFTEQHHYAPGLGVVLVGDDPASQMYVRMKRKNCKEVGIESYAHYLPADATQAQVEEAVLSLNQDTKVHGILVQLPLPKHLNEEAVLNLISLEKDADGIHPLNMGLLAMRGREPLFTPATPTGCLVLLKEMNVPIAGANAVVVGRSNIVGMPVALMLTRENATVTICHSKTRDLPSYLREADIVIAAIGLPEFIKGDWLKPGAVVIDVGTNKIDDATAEKGYRYVGDVELESAQAVVKAITKVPGGVGPLTRTMLLANTMKAAYRLTAKA